MPNPTNYRTYLGGLVAAAATDQVARVASRTARGLIGDGMNYAASAFGNYTRGVRARRRAQFSPASGKKVTVRANARFGGLIGLEVKYIDYHWNQIMVQTPTSLPSFVEIFNSGGTNNVGHLSPVPQGTSESERIGRNIFIRSINLKMWVVVPHNSREEQAVADVLTLGSAYITVWIVMDRQANKTSPTAGEIWTNPAVGAGDHGTVANEPFLNMEWRERFKIMKKFNFRVNPETEITGLDDEPTSSVVIIRRSFRLKKKWFKTFAKPLKQTYDTVDGGIADVTNFAMTMWAQYNDETNDPGQAVTVQGIGRVRYTS